MSLPKAGSTYAQERRGVVAVQSYAASRAQIFRETPTGDVGIDAQLEFVNPDGQVTGQTIGLQIKSGPSFFAHSTRNGWKFYPEEKHRTYWERYPLPVILVLHDPEAKRSYWVDVRQALRSPSTATQAWIEIPSTNLLEETVVTRLFENAGVQDEAFIEDLDMVIEAMLERRTTNPAFVLSYLDLFCAGLTNICRSIYFGTDVALEVVESNLSNAGWEFGLGMGQREQNFLFGFVRFLVAQHLADVNFADCLIDVIDRHMTPTFMAPLTGRGRAVVNALHEREAELVRKGQMPDGRGELIAQEAFVTMDRGSYGSRLDRLFQFQAVFTPKKDP
ncbi:DUF4365 domain-containing protein [Myxococcus qinghaiensis]|uniref:DUF4365 domain-containing protein n=1 Tax=Myxococcus qinghaiensis TaxID=2906758 RepID=UPI0020A7DB94|nr:DUF4365 domain-containing protein [Myxococcus qinghaiensis]MCP3169941.1 DUF4365 domain-containing protein [Myxococcus qinghaiensis]